jgi:hypothetical protein
LSDFVVMVVPHGTVTVASEATVQLAAVTAVPPLSVTPVPPACSAMMQAAALGLTSAYDVALTDNVELLWMTLARNSGAEVVTVTWTALLPLPEGEGTRAATAAPTGNPFSAARLLTAEFIVVTELLAL